MRAGRIVGMVLGAGLVAGLVGADEGGLTARETARLAALRAERVRLDATVWQEEVLAQRREEPVVRLWDALRAAADPYPVAAAWPFATLVLSGTATARAEEDGIRVTPSGGPGARLDAAGWQALLADARARGYRLVQEEFHHAEFHWNDGHPRSVFKINLHVVAPDGGRIEWRGPVVVAWSSTAGGLDGLPGAGVVDASGLERVERGGGPGFEPGMARVFARAGGGMPGALLAADLDGDGVPELMLTGTNQRFRRPADPACAPEPLVAHPATPMLAGLVADVTGDSVPDLVVAGGLPLPRLLVYRGAPGGRFLRAPVPACAAPLDLTKPMVITAGDVDGDGDTDLWVGQYKNPYLQGQLPAPYWDAADGFPCYLLLNDGHGRFTDATAAAGFAAKRNRRTYGGALLDVDGDGDLDLVTANDFAGADVWLNDGRGRFRDATATALDDPMSFGMSLVADDFDNDGAIDLYVTGMGSTTMRRLAAMGLQAPGRDEVSLTRTRMGYGNRLYLRTAPGVFREPAWHDQVARSGWSWGAVSADFDRDGDRDLYVANGNMTGRSAADYCTTFWCHDLYTPTRGQERVAQALHLDSMRPVAAGETSWNGFEKKRLFLNRGGTGFLEAGWALGAALEDDAHNLVAADFDRDGRTDLALVYEDRSDPALPLHARFGLKVLLNRIDNAHHWLGIRLRAGPRTGPWGAEIRVRTSAGPRTAVIVAGDSWASQQPAEKVFGLGAGGTATEVEVRWPGGVVGRVPVTGIDRYMEISPP